MTLRPSALVVKPRAPILMRRDCDYLRSARRGQPDVGGSRRSGSDSQANAKTRDDRHPGRNAQFRPLLSHQTSVQLIASTKAETGLNNACDIDWGHYPKGIKISKAALKNLNIRYDDFHGDWNYTIAPIAKTGAGSRG